jgi:hypothetical protein
VGIVPPAYAFDRFSPEVRTPLMFTPEQPAITGLLFEVPSTDPPTYVAGAAALFGIALLACTIPALRALRVGPRESLVHSH